MNVPPPRRPAARAILALGVIALLAAIAVGACSPKKTVAPDLPPETTLFLQGAADTVNHVVHLYWFGTDPDGEVTGFEWRIIGPGTPADPAWAFTTRTDSIFEIQTPGGFSQISFQVRAIDNDGLRDPTPARNDSLQFRDRPPVVTLVDPPRAGFNDTTFASVTLSWAASDPDGDAMRFRVWLDGNEAAAQTTTSLTTTVPTSAFVENGFFYSRIRTAYVQAIDNGGMAGPIDSTKWYVKAPSGTVWPANRRAKLLIVDDIVSTDPNNTLADGLFLNAAEARLPDSTFGRISVTPTSLRPSFRSAADVEQTLKLFDAVVWYRANQAAVAPFLRDDQAALAAYLDSGGRLFLEGLNLVNGRHASGALSQDFMLKYFHVQGMFVKYDLASNDSTAAWPNVNGGRVRSSLLADSLKFNGAMVSPGVRAFMVSDTTDVLAWSQSAALDVNFPDQYPIALSVHQPNGGQAVIVAFAIQKSTGYFNVPRFLDKILGNLLGITFP